MDKWLGDLRYGLRTLRKSPGFTAVVLCTLALGIGANTAIFSVVHSVLLRSLPYRQPDRLATVWESLPEPGFEKFRVAPGNYLDWQDQNRVFEDMAMFGASRFSLTGEGEPESLLGGKVTESYFRTLGVAPLIGRVFSKEEETPGRDRVVLLSHGLWQRRFGSDREILGRPIAFDGQLFTIIGVMPQGIYPTWLNSVGRIQFRPDHHQFWVPMALPEGFRTTRSSHVFGVLARLKTGTSFQTAQSEMETIGRRLEQAYPENAKEGVAMTRLADEVVGDVRSGLLLLLGAVGFVLATVCANIAGLVLARSASRQREVAVRAALGAGRRDFIRQFFTESLLLGLGGGALGLGVAYLGRQALTRITPHQIPRLGDDKIDLTVLCFAAAVSILATVMFGLLPALQSMKPDLLDSLKKGGRGTTHSDPRHAVRKALVVAEVSLAVVLVLGAGLLMRSFWQLVQVDPGFRADRILTFELDLAQARYPQWSRVVNTYSNILERVRALPGVRSAAIAYDLPVEANWETGFRIAGRPEPNPGEGPGATLRLVSPDYFRTTGIELLRGRVFFEQDDAEHPGVAIINSSLARKFFLGEDPMGQTLQHHNTSEDLPESFEIVGVVQDVRFRGLDAVVEPALYLSARQFVVGDMGLLVRTAEDPLALLASVRAEVAAVDSDLPMFRVATLEGLVENSVAQPRFNMLLLSLFGLAALILAAMGIYGLLSHTVAERTHEIGVRMAVGAQASDVLRLFVGQGIRLAAVGLVLGILGAFSLARVMESLLFGVSSTDAATLISVVATLGVVAGFASYLPARRATKVDPLVALRHE